MGGNGLALGLGSNRTMQDEGACGRNRSVVLLDRDTVRPAHGEDGSNFFKLFAGAIAEGRGTTTTTKTTTRHVI